MIILTGDNEKLEKASKKVICGIFSLCYHLLNHLQDETFSYQFLSFRADFSNVSPITKEMIKYHYNLTKSLFNYDYTLEKEIQIPSNEVENFIQDFFYYFLKFCMFYIVMSNFMYSEELSDKDNLIQIVFDYNTLKDGIVSISKFSDTIKWIFEKKN